MTQPAAVEIRRYRNASDYQLDAASMAQAGWSPIMQSETTGGASGAWIIITVLCVLGGFLIHYLLLIVAIVAAIAALVNRKRVLVVTYRPDVLLRA